MPPLTEYITESDEYDEEDMALIPEELRTQINRQLEIATSSGETTEPK